MKRASNTAKVVHVAVGVIRRVCGGQKQIFLSKRLSHVHQGGLWEFPGGKVEPEETVKVALCRELREELGIEIDPTDERALEPLIKIRHDYPDKSVLLDVWTVSLFTGEPIGREGQEVRWVDQADLSKYPFPVANVPIISACQLPSSYVITPGYASLDIARKEVALLLEKEPEMLLFRQPNLSASDYIIWVKELLDMFPNLGSRLMLGGQVLSKGSPSSADIDVLDCLWSQVKGVQLPFKLAQTFNVRPVANELCLAVSCHNEAELAHARTLGANFVTLSPVNETSSHPRAKSLGWAQFEELVRPMDLPVFALGGMRLNDLPKARDCGAQGIAGIRLWQ